MRNMNAMPAFNPDREPKPATETGKDTTDDAPIPVDCPKRMLDAGELGLGTFVCSQFGDLCQYTVTRGLFATNECVQPCRQEQVTPLGRTALGMS